MLVTKSDVDPATLRLDGVKASITSMSLTVTAFTNISFGADLISYKSPNALVGSVGTNTTEFTMSPISLCIKADNSEK